MDKRFKYVTDFPKLRYFRNGISFVSQWTGTEHKEMERVFLGLLPGGGVHSKVVKAARGILDFIYCASLTSHTNDSLTSLREALTSFHNNKDIFIDTNIRHHFRLPKLHSLDHYEEAIRALGSADGYNTESPEHLHIDYAKSAYRSTNKRDHIQQMTVWLQRREALWLRQVYIDWLDAGLSSAGKPEFVSESDLELDDGASPSELATPVSTSTNTYIVAKLPPLRHCTVSTIETDFGASQFLPALSTYLQTHLQSSSSIQTPNMYDQFNLYKQADVVVFPSRYISTSQQGIRTRPFRAAEGRKGALPAVFDTVLVISDREKYIRGCGLQGLCAARIRVIFELPSYLGAISHPLVYLEWFTPFGTIDPNTQFYIIKPAIQPRSRERKVSILPLSYVVDSCHLIPMIQGREPNPAWDTFSTLDLGDKFFFNHYINLRTFSLVKLQA